MTNKLENLLQRFDEEFRGYLVVTDGRDTVRKPRNDIKQFLQEAIQEVIEDMVGERYIPFPQTTQYAKVFKTGYKYSRRELIQKAKQWGVEIKD